MNMDEIEAVYSRHSVRLYKPDPLSDEIISKLQAEMDAINKESGLCIRLFTNEPKAFNGILMKTVVKFKNAVNYFSIAGPDTPDLEEKVGYYGERLVLYVQTLGLNTCWAMMAKKKESSKDLENGMRTVISISVGYGEDQGVPHKSKPIDAFGDMKDAPEWFVKGVEFAMLAPTGVNKQGFKFERDGDKVRIITGSSALSRIDGGIAKYHFELGAGKENFTWIQ